MEKTWKDKWNERYSNREFAYGKEPNKFLKQELDKLQPGSILFPAEGEGRNAIYAAKLGWDVYAFDISIEGKKKANELAKSHNVNIDYKVGALEELGYDEDKFDAIALIYAHFPAAIKSHYHSIFNKYLRKDGIIIFEAFSKKHLNYNEKDGKVGGPKDVESLFSIEEIQSDFPNYDFKIVKE